jgi:hypothetical protein
LLSTGDSGSLGCAGDTELNLEDDTLLFGDAEAAEKNAWLSDEKRAVRIMPTEVSA